MNETIGGEETRRRGRPTRNQELPKFGPEPTETGTVEVPTVGFPLPTTQPQVDERTRAPKGGVTCWASIAMTINMGNYENQKIDIGISGVPVDADDAYIDEQLNQASVTLEKIISKLGNKMRERLEAAGR